MARRSLYGIRAVAARAGGGRPRAEALCWLPGREQRGASRVSAHRDGLRPQLIRDGAIDVDLGVEEFGPKDSTVISFFLPRVVDRYQAARSFIGINGAGRILLGVVSGRAFGVGVDVASAGMTFGELAQLAYDLGATEAMGLDGGGSSSLIASIDGRLALLNTPTGGSDVPRGTERFIANGLLVFKRSEA